MHALIYLTGYPVKYIYSQSIHLFYLAMLAAITNKPNILVA